MAVLIERIVNKPVESNSFIIYQTGIDSCIVVDPGTTDCHELVDFFEQNKLLPEYIILSHEHFDHLTGVNRLKDTFGSKIICSKVCSGKIGDIKKNMSVFYDQIGFQSYTCDILVEDINFRLEWGNTFLEFVPSMGHTDASICIVTGHSLFTGDTIIPNHKTVTKFPGGSKTDLSKSIEMLFSRFKGKNFTVFPGHGDIFPFDELSINNLL
jgi:hydroxyacylglutathione hydrolase